MKITVFSDPLRETQHALFITTQWNYKLECGSVKAAGGHNLQVEARALLKISSPPEDPVLSTNQWFHVIHGEDGVGHSYLPSSWYHRRPMAIVFLGRKRKLSSSTVKTLQAATDQPPPGSTINDQLHPETST